MSCNDHRGTFILLLILQNINFLSMIFKITSLSMKMYISALLPPLLLRILKIFMRLIKIADFKKYVVQRF